MRCFCIWSGSGLILVHEGDEIGNLCEDSEVLIIYFDVFCIFGCGRGLGF